MDVGGKEEGWKDREALSWCLLDLLWVGLCLGVSRRVYVYHVRDLDAAGPLCADVCMT